jgi:hypothetical protein
MPVFKAQENDGRGAPRFSVCFFFTTFSTQACFLWKNGLFFYLRAVELRVEKKKAKKRYTRDTGGGARPASPSSTPARPAPRHESHGPHAAVVAS